jgi:hypothetical protein
MCIGLLSHGTELKNINLRLAAHPSKQHTQGINHPYNIFNSTHISTDYHDECNYLSNLDPGISCDVTIYIQPPSNLQELVFLSYFWVAGLPSQKSPLRNAFSHHQHDYLH